MDESRSQYYSFSKEFSKSLDNLKKKLKNEVRKKTRSYEINELINIGSKLNTLITARENGGPFINHATFYDSVSTIKELAESALIEFNIKELKEIENETSLAAESAAKKMTVRKASTELLNYSSSLSDLSIISESIKEICLEINKSMGSEEKYMNGKTIFFESRTTINFFKDLKTKINGIIDRMKYVIGSASDALKKGIKKTGKILQAISISRIFRCLEIYW